MKTVPIQSLSLLLASIASQGALAFPIAAPGTEGLLVVTTSTDPITATYQGNSASFSNDLYLMLDGAGNPGDDGNTANDLFIFNNKSVFPGATANLGSYAAGTELIFRLHVNNTNFDYFTGPPSRNIDNHEHARVQENWLPNQTLVSFEDLRNGPFVYNDLSFSFTNTTSAPVPIPATIWFLGSAVTAFAFTRRKSV